MKLGDFLLLTHDDHDISNLKCCIATRDQRHPIAQDGKNQESAGQLDVSQTLVVKHVVRQMHLKDMQILRRPQELRGRREMHKLINQRHHSELRVNHINSELSRKREKVSRSRTIQTIDSKPALTAAWAMEMFQTSEVE